MPKSVVMIFFFTLIIFQGGRELFASLQSCRILPLGDVGKDLNLAIC